MTQFHFFVTLPAFLSQSTSPRTFENSIPHLTSASTRSTALPRHPFALQANLTELLQSSCGERFPSSQLFFIQIADSESVSGSSLSYLLKFGSIPAGSKVHRITSERLPSGQRQIYLPPEVTLSPCRHTKPARNFAIRS